MSRPAKTASTVTHLLDSPVPCMISDELGIVRAASPGLVALGLAPTGRALTDVFQLLPVAEFPVGGDVKTPCFRALDVEGRPLYLLIEPVQVAAGETLHVVSDFTAFRRTEEARFAATPYPILRLSKHSRIVFANQSAARALGTEPADLAGQAFAGFFPPDSEKELNEALTTDALQPLDFDLPAPLALRNQGVTDIRLHLMPDFGPDCRVLGRIAVLNWDPWERWRDRISSEVNAAQGFDDAMSRLLAIVREVVPHDRASFGILAEERSKFRRTFVFPHGDAPPSRRWIDLPPEMSKRVADDPFVDRNWRAILAANPQLTLDPVTMQHNAEGMRSILTIPVGVQGAPRALLTLLSANPAAFDGPALAIAGALRLDAVLASLLRLAEREDAVAIKRILDSLLGAESFVIAAELLLMDLVEHYRWDHAALHEVDSVGKRIRLLRQYPVFDRDGAPSDLAIPAGYERPLDPACPELGGMMGQTVLRGQSLVVADTASGDAESRHYFRPSNTCGAQRSAMTVPVKLDGEVRWVLGIVSRTTSGFGEEDRREVEEIVPELVRRVTLLRERLLNRELLEIGEQGVVVTDGAGRIVRANRRARDLLHLGGDMAGWGTLSSYGADDATRALLDGKELVERRQIRVAASGGVGNAVLVSRRNLASDVGEAVWLFTDLRAEEWQHDSSFIENTIREVASQARGPLMLATSFVKRLATQAAANGLASKAVAELGKADITYQRIADSLAARKEPRRVSAAVALDEILRGLVRALPPADRARIELDLPRHTPEVSGDRSRLEMALTLMLCGLLSHSADLPLQIGLHRRGRTLILRLAAAQPDQPARSPRLMAPQPGDPLETAAIIFAAHDGRLRTAVGAEGASCCEATLPLAEPANGP